MPQYIMDTSGEVSTEVETRNGWKGRTWGILDYFTQGYIEAMFFTADTEHAIGDENGNDTEEAENLTEAPFSDLAPETLASIIADCTAWQAKNADLLNAAMITPDNEDDSTRDNDYGATGYGLKQAGRDYWFTRNGHGVGFWDRPQLAFRPDGQSKELGELLSDACRSSELNLYRGDDGKLYLA